MAMEIVPALNYKYKPSPRRHKSHSDSQNRYTRKTDYTLSGSHRSLAALNPNENGSVSLDISTERSFTFS